MEVKKNIRQFSGFAFSDDSVKRKNKVDKLKKYYRGCYHVFLTLLASSLFQSWFPVWETGCWISVSTGIIARLSLPRFVPVVWLLACSVVLVYDNENKNPVNGNEMVLVNLTETETNAITLT